MKKFRKRNKDESILEYLDFLLLTFWPITLLAQLALSGIYCGILGFILYDLQQVKFVGFVTLFFVFSMFIFVIAYHFKAHLWADLFLYRMISFSFWVIVINVGLFILVLDAIF